MRVRWLKALAQFSPQYQLTSPKEGVFPIIGPAKRGIEKSVADGIVAAIRQPRSQWIGPKPPRLKRIEVLLSLLEGSQRVTLPESDV